MPIYTYRCENCGVQFDRHQSFNDAPLTRCPECNKKTLRKVYLPVGIVFKGSGFYSTDHRSPSGASRSSSGDKAGEKASERASEKPSEKSGEKSGDNAKEGDASPGAPPEKKEKSG